MYRKIRTCWAYAMIIRLIEYHSIVELILVKIKLVSEFEHFQRLSIWLDKYRIHDVNQMSFHFYLVIVRELPSLSSSEISSSKKFIHSFVRRWPNGKCVATLMRWVRQDFIFNNTSPTMRDILLCDYRVYSTYTGFLVYYYYTQLFNIWRRRSFLSF